MKTTMHEKAVDWALKKGLYISVTDLSCPIFCEDPDDDEWDIKHSQDKRAIMEALGATDVPNAHLFTQPDDESHILVFSVIDEGQPDETINDYTVSEHPWSREFDKWFMDQ